MVPTSSGLNSPRWIERSWELPEPSHGSGDNMTLRTGTPMDSQAQESRWPSSSPLTEGSRSALLMLHPYRSGSSSTPIERYGIPPPRGRILTLRPRTADEQTALEDALAGVVWQETPWRSPSCHVGSPEVMQPGTTCPCRCPTRRHYGGTELTKERGGVVSSQLQKEMTRWKGEDPAPPERPGPTDEERIEQVHDLYKRE